MDSVYSLEDLDFIVGAEKMSCGLVDCLHLEATFTVLLRLRKMN